MKLALIAFLIFSALSFFLDAGCQYGAAGGVKDLDENMMDLRIYHDALGTALKKGNFEEADWLLGGMDSIFRVVSLQFNEHRKLEKPFIDYYRSDIKKPVQEMAASIKAADLPSTLAAYRLLTRKCNGCHQELDIEKEVQDWSR